MQELRHLAAIRTNTKVIVVVKYDTPTLYVSNRILYNSLRPTDFGALSLSDKQGHQLVTVKARVAKFTPHILNMDDDLGHYPEFIINVMELIDSL